MTYNFLSRTRIISVCLLLAALVLVGKLFLVQVIEHKNYTARADHQYATPFSDLYERHTIFFQDKDGTLISAAVQVTGYKVAIDPALITDPETVYAELSKNATVDHTIFITDAAKKTDPYEEVAHHLTKEQADAISALKISGVSIYQENQRFYPGGSLASHTLGLVGYDGNTLGGRYGLEREYDSTLSESADNPYINFFAQVFSNISNTFKPSQPTGDLVTTIEPQVQEFLENELTTTKAKYDFDTVGGIIMNPQDGSIYAMSAKPDFNPNNFADVKDPYLFSNPLVENVFEFGSVVKPLVMAAALDTGAVNLNTTYDDTPCVTLNGSKICNYDIRGRGPNTPMQTILNDSLNVGMTFVSQKLGHENERNYFLAYGVGEKTGIDLPNETTGLISNLNSPRDVEYATAAFGQGIALTPMEITRAEASLGNGGILVTPHVVKAIKYDDGTEKVLQYPTTRTKISAATSKEITGMLVTVMDKAFQNGAAKMPHYSVAMKTGTAQVANPNGGGYYSNIYLHSFMGYFPASNPQFIVFIYGVNPKGVPYASQTWGQPFIDITKFLLSYYDVPPDR